MDNTTKCIIEEFNHDLVWTSKGFRIPKNGNETIPKKLTIYSKVKSDFPGPKPRVSCFKQEKEYFYIPRYYAESNFGKARLRFKQSVPEINLKFNGEMRDYQYNTVNKTIEQFKTVKGGMWSIGTGMGKCLSKDTPVRMFDGKIALVQDISVGDKIMGDNSTCRNVLSVCTGQEMLYNVKYKSGECYTVNESHILSLVDLNDKFIDIELKDYINNPSGFRGYRKQVHFQENNIDISPKNIALYVTGFGVNIPENYLINSIDIRDYILTEILDLIGKTDNGTYVVNRSDKFSDDIYYLATGLGYDISNYDKDFFTISGNHKELTILDIVVTPIGIGSYFGFEIDNNRRFLLGDSTVTHNTVMALNLISKVNMKTLIVVHKNILMDQWKERILQFLPDAKVGKLQADVIDSEGCDIVLGMVQSLTRKEYPSGTFKDFGLLIVDEAHVMCSKLFSDVLFKVQTEYRLGLSATPSRSDGFDLVLEHHLGPIFVEIHRTTVVPSIKFFYTEINNTVGDIKVEMTKFGSINSAKLITDIASCEIRNQFIIKIIIDLLKKEKTRKLLVFSDRVIQCERLAIIFNDYISNLNETDITNPLIGLKAGSFVGSNSKEKNDISIDGNIMFATYGICKEGFDCPKLDTLVFATPKSEITQAVGRILRQKNENPPLIYDIVDTAGSFKGQYYKRRKYYKNKEYVIEGESNVIEKLEKLETKIGRCIIKD
jgi:superfamily II DNA or RNA helicase